MTCVVPPAVDGVPRVVGVAVSNGPVGLRGATGGKGSFVYRESSIEIFEADDGRRRRRPSTPRRRSPPPPPSLGHPPPPPPALNSVRTPSRCGSGHPPPWRRKNRVKRTSFLSRVVAAAAAASLPPCL